MRISQLEYIIAIEKYGSINAAANHLFVSQSQISSAVKSLEEELGQPLFVRSSKGIRITSFGMEILPYARFIMNQIGQLKNLGKQFSPSYTLNICSNGFRFPFRIAAQFGTEHPELNNIYVRHCSRQAMIDLISNHSAEIGVTQIWNFQSNVIRKQLQTKNVTFFPCAVKPAAIVVGKGNPLYDHRGNTISADRLNSFPYLSCDYSQYNPNMRLLEQVPKLNPKRFLYTSDLPTSIEMLHNCDAFMIVADSGMPEHNLGEFPECRILELEGCKWFAQIGWMKHRQSELSALAQSYADRIDEYLKNR